MILISNYSNYFINSFHSQKLNKTIYLNIEYAELFVEFLDNKLILNFSFYIAQSFFLPPDSLMLSIQLPSQEAQNILLIKSNDKIDPNLNLLDKDKINIFKGKIVIDTLGDNYFSDTKSLINIPIKCFFNISTKSFQENGVSISPEHFYWFVSEINSQTINFNFPYWNYFELTNSNSKDLFLPLKIKVDSNNKLLIDNKKINFFQETNINKKLPIKRLFFIKTEIEDTIQINNINLSIIFNYKNKTNKLSKSISNSFYFQKNFDFITPYEIFYDNSLDTYSLKRGDNGIKFNFNTPLIYQVSFNLILLNRNIECFIENEIMWTNDLINKMKVLNVNNLEITNGKVLYEN